MALLGRGAPKGRQPDAPSPERTALALAIEAAQAVKARRDAAIATESPATAVVKAAEDAVADAAAQLGIAKASAARSVSASMLAGDVLELPPALRAARAALAEAEDRLDVARAARDHLNTRRSDVDTEAAAAQARVATARAAVIRAEGGARVKALTAELIAAQRRMVDLKNELEWLIKAGAVPVVEEPGSSFGTAADRELRVALFRSTSGYIPLQGERLEDLMSSPSPASVWSAAAAALEADAFAPLPFAG